MHAELQCDDQYADDRAQYEADMNQAEADTIRIIEKARHQPITEDEAALLRWAAGVSH